jgi:quercetin dioxygenase-like cupin family protein
VLEGELEFIIAGESRLLHPGEIYMIPGGVEHMVRVGDSPAKVLDVFSPVREDLKY